MKTSVVVAIAIFASSDLQAQQSDAQRVAQLRARPAQVTAWQQPRCMNKALNAGLTTVLGGVVGWGLFMTSIGIFASDHGEVYQDLRRKFIIGGALIGAAFGVHEALTKECIVLSRPGP